MENKATSIEQTVLPPHKLRELKEKQDAISRFLAAKEFLGKDWKKRLAAFEPYFNTWQGSEDMKAIASAVNRPQKATLQRMLVVVEALERMVEFQKKSA